MPTVEVSHVGKCYGDKVAVEDLSFSVSPGEVLALIGPNGAGKTTTIRMLMDIVRPDSGSVTVLGGRPNEATKDRIGYLPEERGLYRKLKVVDCVVYLATLKGMDRRSAERETSRLLEQVGMLPARNRRVEELSHGMAQLVQVVVTIVHDPALVIFDEPFSSLDPVNAELLKALIGDLRARGKAIILSTHRMNEVEALCDRLLMLNKGRSVLYGSLAEIQSRFRRNSVLLKCDGEIGDLPGVSERRAHNGSVELVLDGTLSPRQILEKLVARGQAIDRFEVATPSLNDIFLTVAGDRDE